jgi:hypothetical protein
LPCAGRAGGRKSAQPFLSAGGPDRRGGGEMRSAFLSAIVLYGAAAAAAESAVTIEQLLQDGWEIAGYTGTFDNRSSLMLFHRKDKNYLVQCSVLYDVTRSPRTSVNCYELH